MTCISAARWQLILIYWLHWLRQQYIFSKEIVAFRKAAVRFGESLI